jgi:hypothetical protein
MGSDLFYSSLQRRMGVLIDQRSMQVVWNVCVKAGITRLRSSTRATSRHTGYEGESVIVSSSTQPRVEVKAKLRRRRMSVGKSPTLRGGRRRGMVER